MENLDRVIDDDQLLLFAKKNLSKPLKKLLGIKIPSFGKNRGKLLINSDHYVDLVSIYVTFCSTGLSPGYPAMIRTKAELELDKFGT